MQNEQFLAKVTFKSLRRPQKFGKSPNLVSSKNVERFFSNFCDLLRICKNFIEVL